MNALQLMDRYRKELMQVSTQKHDIKVQYLYDSILFSDIYSNSHQMLGHLEFTTKRAPLINQYFYQPDPKEPEEDAEPRVAFSNMQFVSFGFQLDTE